EGERDPRVDRAVGGIGEASGHDTGNDERLPVQLDRAPYYRRSVAAKTARPEAVAQHHHTVAANNMFFADKRASAERWRAQCLKESVRHERDAEALGIPLPREVEP